MMLLTYAAVCVHVFLLCVQVQNAFFSGAVQVIVATIAFGKHVAGTFLFGRVRAAFMDRELPCASPATLDFEAVGVC